MNGGVSAWRGGGELSEQMWQGLAGGGSLSIARFQDPPRNTEPSVCFRGEVQTFH